RLSRTGEALLNLKDLLTAFPSRLKGLFENEPVLKRFLATKLYQILPFSTKNVQRTGSNRAQDGGFSRPISLKHVKTRQVPWLVSSCHWRCGWDRLYGPAFPEGKAGKSEEYGSYRSSARWGRRAR